MSKTTTDQTYILENSFWKDSKAQTDLEEIKIQKNKLQEKSYICNDKTDEEQVINFQYTQNFKKLIEFEGEMYLTGTMPYSKRMILY